MAWLTIILGGTFVRKEDLPAPVPAPVPLPDDASCCYNGGRKHDYKARITQQTIVTQPDGLMQMAIGKRWSPEDLANVLRACTASKEEYNADVCTWCGDVIHHPAHSRIYPSR